MWNNIVIDGMAFAAPLFIMAMGGMFSEKAGITNLCVEGFQGFGAFIGCLVAVAIGGIFAGGSQVPIYIGMFFAAVGGALIASLHALLCIKLRADQTISGVVINTLATALTTFFTTVANTVMNGNASNKFVLSVFNRFTVPGISKVPVIGPFFTKVYPFEIIVIIVAFFMWYLMYKTRFGMHMRACGENPQAVDAAGGNVQRTRLISVLISGALCGIGGLCFAYSISSNFSPSIYMGYGYLAISAMIFGNWNILPTAAVCLFFGFAKSAGYQFCLAAELNSSFTDIFNMLPYILTLILLVFFSKKNHAPRAAGKVYDKGER